MNLDQDLFKPYKRLLIEVDDVEDENLLQHFKATNAFIQQGLDSGGGVFVHWYVRVLDLYCPTPTPHPFRCSGFALRSILLLSEDFKLP